MCFREFGDRVKHWTTISEANAFSLSGYDWGVTPPRRCSYPYGNCSRGDSTTEAYIAAHHILLSHASAYRLYEKNYKVIFKLFHVKFFHHGNKLVNISWTIMSTRNSNIYLLIFRQGCTMFQSDREDLEIYKLITWEEYLGTAGQAARIRGNHYHCSCICPSNRQQGRWNCY